MLPWNTKYWDTLDQIYWTPDYVGLRPVRPISDPSHPDVLILPRSEVPSGNSLYTRSIKSKDMAAHLRRREETLNHILDIGLAIAPDALINLLVAMPLGFEDAGPYDSVGREIDQRFGITENAFQQDGFFISSRSALALEIKLKSSSSPEQVLKYALMLAMEEEITGHRQNVGLLYVVPAGIEDALWRGCGLDGPRMRPDLIELVRSRKMPGALQRLIEPREAEVRGLMARMTLGCVSWTWLRDKIASVERALDDTDPAQQCYRRLLLGMRHQIEAHADTGIKPG
jgi:hypothetical protein